MKTNDFEYKYVAPTNEERKEIESIRKSYLPQNNDVYKLNRLRRLDSVVKRIPIIIALTIGVVGMLIFGLGLTLVLEWNLLAWGAVVGILGAVIMIGVYPLYLRASRYFKEKHSKEILEISEELLNDEK